MRSFRMITTRYGFALDGQAEMLRTEAEGREELAGRGVGFASTRCLCDDVARDVDHVRFLVFAAF